MLIMTCICDLNAHSIDFRNAFTQAEKKGPQVYMACLPGVGMNSDDVMILKKIMYNQAELPTLCFEKLKDGLEYQSLSRQV